MGLVQGIHAAAADFQNRTGITVSVAVDGLDALGPWRLLLLPDHPTPIALKTHTADPVPYLLVDSTVDDRKRK